MGIYYTWLSLRDWGYRVFLCIMENHSDVIIVCAMFFLPTSCPEKKGGYVRF